MEPRRGRSKSVLSADKTTPGKASADTQLIARAQRGDEGAFEALFSAHKRRVYSLCLRMTGDTAEAEDLAQEAFLQLFRKISTFRGESAFTTWLHRLVVNVVLMHLRKKAVQTVSLDEPDTSQDEPVKRDYGEDDLRLLGSADRIRLNQAIGSLPQGYRTVFVLHDIEGYEHNEIARMMNCSIGNSKSQLHKARLKLRELLRSERKEARTGVPPELALENGR
jgi:RNA polymerase sigma-70 factor (ECF subfamily)